MKKLYFVILISFVSLAVNAQRRNDQRKFIGPQPLKAKIGAAKQAVQPNAGTSRTNNFAAATCGPLNLPIPDSWGKPTLYIWDPAGTIDSGYITGTNPYYDYWGLAQYFDESGTTYNYVSGVKIGFGAGYSDYDSLEIPIQIYDGASGKPGKRLGSTSVYATDIMEDVKHDRYTLVRFDPPIKLLATKKFFAVVDMENVFSFLGDSLAIVSSQANKATGAWGQIDTSDINSSVAELGWFPFTQLFKNLDLGLYIHPYVSENLTCDALPVKLTAFTAQGKGGDVLLNWQVAQEVNMKQYTVERSTTGRQFATAGSVAATNSATPHGYSFTDAGIANTATTLYYRIKQEDKDGSVSYSKIIPVTVAGANLSVKVVNPFKNTVQLQVNAPAAQKLQGGIYDMQGRKVANAPAQVLVAGQNTISIPAGNLPKGVYMLTITIGKNTLKYKIVN